jgi:hypothetical protein
MINKHFYKYNSAKREVKILIIALNIIIILYFSYLVITLISNLFMKRIDGEIISEYVYTEHLIWFYKGRFYSGKLPMEEDVLRKDIYYKYNVNQKEFVSKRIVNILIFPNLSFNIGDKVSVYYNIIIPKYSVLYKWNILFFIYNIIPLIILIIINIILRNKINMIKAKRHIIKR